MSLILDYHTLCRLCLVKEHVDNSIFNESNKNNIYDKIKYTLPIQIAENDNLPKKICENCSQKLDSLYDFINTALNAEKQLFLWFKELELDTNLPESDKDGHNVIPKQETNDEQNCEQIFTTEYLFNNNNQEKTKENDQKDKPTRVLNQPKKRGRPPGKRNTRSKSKNKICEDEISGDENSVENVVKQDEDFEMVEQGDRVAKEETQSDDDFEPTDFVEAQNDQPGPSGLSKNVQDERLLPKLNSNVGILRKLFENGAVEKPETVELLVTKLRKTGVKIEKIVIDSEPNIIHDHRCNIPKNICQSVNFGQTQADEIPKCKLFKQGVIKNHLEFQKSDTAKNVEGLVKLKKNDIPILDQIKEIEKPDIVLTPESKQKTENIEEIINIEKFEKKISNSKNIISESLKLSNSESEYGIEILDFEPVQKSSKNHFLDIKSTKYLCVMCLENFSTCELIFEHIQKPCSTFRIECSICSKSFDKKAAYFSHLQSHKSKKRYFCEKCGKDFSNFQSLNIHMENSHTKIFDFEENHFFCRFCSEKSKNKRCMIRHIHEKHIKIEDFLCEKCGKTFLSENSLKTHLLIHQKKGFSCSICRKSFITKSALNFHYKTIHGSEKHFSSGEYQQNCTLQNPSLKLRGKNHERKSEKLNLSKIQA